MTKIDDFGVTSRVAVTVLVDNRADLMVLSTRNVRRFTQAPLLAEHGFAALIELKAEGVTILWDAGMTEATFMENVRRMKVNLSRVTAIVLSHAHGDHTAGITAALKAMALHPRERKWSPNTPWEEIERYAAGRRVPLVAHSAAFRERWGVDQDGSRHGPGMGLPRSEWEAAGAEIVLADRPHRLAPGCWTTGQVPRNSFEQAGRPKRLVFREGRQWCPDDLEEDQAIVIHVANKGLVVVSGCAHSGIVNTVNHAREISGVDRVFAILGGFHLARANEQERKQTIAAIQQFEPRLIAPTHCTGFPAMAEFSAEMPGAFVEGVVGTKYLF